MKTFPLLILLFCSFSALSQVGIGTESPNTSSLLDIVSTDAGILIPRMEESDRTTIANPAQGLLVYQIDEEDGFWYYDGSIWIRLSFTGEFISESGVVHNTTNINSDDFVFGSSQLDNMTGADDDSRMFFDKNKAAFRAGYNNNTDWDNANLGTYSVGMGRDNLVTSSYGVALGRNNTVSGNNATAFGYINNASGDYALSTGRGTTASGAHSISGGNASRASGLNSLSIGNTSEATAENAIALGRLNDATALSSVAIGFTNVASGENSFSLGNNNVSSGVGSFTIGNNLVSQSASEIVVGTYNTRYTPSSTTDFAATDRLFTIGNGSRSGGTTTFNNALTVLKNSNTGINTSSPQSSLDVRAANHLGAVSATDGLLVPRVIDLTINGNQNGQLVFLNATWVNTMGTTTTNDDISVAAGFYYWSTAATAWLPLNTNVEPWNKSNTTQAATSNTDNIYTLGQVGIGTTNPLGALHVTTENSRDILFFRFINEENDDLDIDLFRSRGTVASPALLTHGTRLGGLRGQSLTNAGAYTFRPAAEIFFKSDGASTSSSSPGSINMSTTPTGTTSTIERLVIREDGDVGINQPDPQAKLDLNGSLRITNGSQINEAVLTGNSDGDAIWDKRAITKHVKANTSTANENLVATNWIRIRSNGTNGQIVIENTSTTGSLAYFWNSNNNSSRGNGSISAGSTTTITIASAGTTANFEIIATKSSNTNDSTTSFKGIIISNVLKGFITYDRL